jgi:gliding motility-associated lipoprotein GldH
MNRFINKYGLFLSVLLFLSACSHSEIFSEFHSFPEAEWARNKKVDFDVNIEDSSLKYDVFLEIRNNNDYPFRNLWLFVDITAPDGKQRADTINVELADVYGKWHGKGISLYSYSFSYDSDMHYPGSGFYTYSVRQGMREEVLKGVSDIGLTVLKKVD